jgi:uncharacterized protein (TIGR02453 family)
MFEGFTKEAGDFLLALKFNNERPWFQAHKEEFETLVNSPFKALAMETSREMSRRRPDMGLDLHVARIYRDARRLHGGGPYKDHLWFSLKNWDGLLRGPMFWFEVGAVDYSFGMGFYSCSAAQMQAFRQSIDASPARFSRIAQSIADRPEYECDPDPYVRPKKDVGELLNPWYNGRRVGVVCTREFGGLLFSPELPSILSDEFEFLMPLYEYLMTYCPPEPWKNK